VLLLLTIYETQKEAGMIATTTTVGRQSKGGVRAKATAPAGWSNHIYLTATPNLATNHSLYVCSISNQRSYKDELTLHSCKPELVQEYNDLRETVEIQRRSTGRPALLILNEAIQVVVDGAQILLTAAMKLMMMASTTHLYFRNLNASGRLIIHPFWNIVVAIDSSMPDKLSQV
jgi:hypothetical protein